MSKLLKDAKAAGFTVENDKVISDTFHINITEKLAKFAALQQPQWQPLETAPKNGEYILMYRKGLVNSARWKGDMWGGDGWCYEFAENLANGFTDNMPTHWMPLPSPPTNTED